MAVAMLMPMSAMENLMNSGYRLAMASSQSPRVVDEQQLGRYGQPRRGWMTFGLLAVMTPVALGADQGAWLEAAGRLHPSLTHFPIALIIAAVVFECVRVLARRDRPSPAALGCLVIAVGGAALASASGWLHADAEGVAGDSGVELHRWLGIAAGSLALLALSFGLFAAGGDRPRSRWGYLFLTLLAASTVGFTGHQGGELTYGEGWVLEPIWGQPAGGANADTPLLVQPEVMPQFVQFETDLLPIFEQNCIKCHGKRKQNGKLRLDSIEALRASPYFDEVVIAGEHAVSPLYERLVLPKTDRDFMPKRGERLAKWQIEMVRRWIDGQQAQVEGGGPVFTPNTGVTKQTTPSISIESTSVDVRGVIAAVNGRGGGAIFESTDGQRLVVNFSVISRPIESADLETLMPSATFVVELNIGGIGATDAVLQQVGALTALERLNVSRSDITDEGLAALSSLDRLEVLNLYGSPVTNASITHIAELPAIRRVYVWQTLIDEVGIDLLHLARPDIEIFAGNEQSAPAEEEPVANIPEETAPEPAETDPDCG